MSYEKLTARPKKYSTVLEIVEDLYGPEFAAEFKQALDESKIIKQLTVIRAIQRSIKEHAAAIGWTAKQVDTFESGRDADVSLETMRQYAAGLGYDIDLRDGRLWYAWKEE